MHGPALPADRRGRRRSRARERGGPAGSAEPAAISARSTVERVMDDAARQARRGRHPQGPRAWLSPRATARRRERLQLLQNRVDREAAVVQGQPVDDAIGIDADASAPAGASPRPPSSLRPEARRRRGRGDRPALPPAAGESFAMLGGGLAAAGERGADLDRALVVGAVEDGGEKRRVARRQMVEQGKAMGGREQGPARQVRAASGRASRSGPGRPCPAPASRLRPCTPR